MANAKKGLVVRGKYSTTIEYEYRGKHYQVEYPNCFTYCVTPPHIQHRDAQREIDREIEFENKPRSGKPVDFDEIYEILGWN